MSNLEERDNELNQKMVDHPAEEAIAVLTRDAKRRTRQVRILTVSVIFDIFLTIGLAFVSYKTNEVVKLAQSNRAAVIANCETANDSRKNNRALWGYILDLPPQQPLTPEQQKRTDDFRKFVDETFKERNCQAEINK